MTEQNQNPIEQYQNIAEDYFGDIIDDAYDPNFGENGGFRVADHATREVTMQILARRLYAHSIETFIGGEPAERDPHISIYETDDAHAVHSQHGLNFEFPDELYDDVDDHVLKSSASMARIAHTRYAKNHDVGSSAVYVEIVPKEILN